MTRLLMFPALLLALTGCRHSCCNQCSQAAPPSCCNSKAMPVSYGAAPAPAFPASYNTPIAAQTTGFPVIPPPSPNAVELPFPTETIPPTTLPVSGAPTAPRNPSLFK